MDDEAVWKRRFHLSMLLRLGGFAVFMLGIAIMFSDLLRPGGWPQPGAILIIIGVVESVVGPKLLRRSWERK